MQGRQQSVVKRRRKPWTSLCFGLPLLVLAASSPAPTSLLVVTDELEAHTITAQHQISGWETAPVKAIIERAGYSSTFQVLTWKGALIAVNRLPTALIYPLARTKEREAQFQWIGRIGSREYYFYKRQGRPLPAVSQLGAMKGYRIAVIAGDVRETFLLEHGFSVGTASGLQSCADSQDAMRRIASDAVDYVIFNPEGLAQYCALPGQACPALQQVMPLGLHSDLYLAASGKASADEVARLRGAYDAMMKDGSLRKLSDSASSPSQ